MCEKLRIIIKIMRYDIQTKVIHYIAQNTIKTSENTHDNILKLPPFNV
jgi:hypothetical protein